ncbi:MAG TPA: RNA 2',3'-cyclic phosphodiesterase [Ornithinibacter sp.]|nr:RNA 2',3'-cyclic phosphodiesterase [Ornithinibacter sp.]
MRLFVAVEPPEDAVEHLDEFLSARRSSGPQLRWASPTQWHVTLAFMGAAPERVVDPLADAVAEAASRTSPLALAVAGGGCFPDVTRAKVLWAGVDDGTPEADVLGRLARGVRSACSVAGASPEGGAFLPHLTLGRFPQAEDATRWVRVLQTYAGPPWVASEVAVIASHLPRERGHRPRHEVLARLPLGG